MLASRDQNMEITEIEIKTPKEVFEEKIRELCHAITDHKEFKEMCSNIDGFMSDEKAKFEFQMLNEMGALLQQKQEMGGEVTEEEAGRFESLRDSFTANEAAMKFVATQEKVQKMTQDPSFMKAAALIVLAPRNSKAAQARSTMVSG